MTESTIHTEATTADERSVNPAEFRHHVDRLSGSAVRVAVYSAPVLFLLITVLLLIVNGSSDVGLFAHVMNSLVSGAFTAVACAGVCGFGLFQMAAVYGKNMETLSHEGRLVEAKRCGRPSIYGGQLMTYTIGGALGVLWEPLAPLLSKQIPIFQVSYTFEVDGRKVRSCELFYGDQAVVLEDDGTAWVFVDPKAPYTRRWLLREPGVLQDCPFYSAGAEKRFG